MRSVRVFITGLLWVVSLMVSAKTPVKAKRSARFFISHFENVLGTSLELKTSAISGKQAGIAEKAALAEIERLSKILSAYDAGSEFSQWLKTSQKPVAVSKELYEVLALFDQWRLRSNGALDASAAVIGELWKQASVKGQRPTPGQLMKAVSEVKQTHWQLDAATHTATHISNVPLMLNSFAKSYIIRSAAAAAMAAAKLNGIIVNIGGDLVVTGNLEETVQVSNPKADAENDAPIDHVSIQNKAIATSGNYRRGELISGRWYSHIVDPRTGEPSGDVLSATVVAASATDAGALATAFNVMKPAESIALAATLPGVEYLIITREGARIESNGWKNLEVSSTPGVNISNTGKLSNTEKDWSNELAITLELSPHQGFAKRPFAAVWIEDKDKATVRNLALWYNKPRWLPDLREWYRKNGRSLSANPVSFNSVTSATRSPGKYTLKWDGKDDNGNTLKKGRYTIYIEVVREHGGYDLLHQEINCDDATQTFNLTGNVEIAGAALDYRKKSPVN